MKVFYSQSLSPYMNLAYENYLLEHLKSEKVLFLYRNLPSVIYGRFQNPWLECNVSKMLKDQVLFVRRQSGGGCVYHDQGNLNFSFLSPKEIYDKDSNAIFIKEILQIDELYISERHDLRLKIGNKDFKVSGSAFKEKKDRAIHHCTLLLSSDLDKLNYYLISAIPEIESKSSKSVRSTVMNLGQKINHDQIIEKINLISEVNFVSEEHMFKELKDDKFYKQMTSLEWIFDETPLFTYKKDNFEIKIKKGLVQSFSLMGDIHPSMQSEIEAYLLNTPHIKDFYSFLETNHTFEFYQEHRESILSELRNFMQVYFFQVEIPS